MRTENEAIDIEFAFTTWNDSCRDLYDFSIDDQRYCRRERGHEGDHAIAWGSRRIRWYTKEKL